MNVSIPVNTLKELLTQIPVPNAISNEPGYYIKVWVLEKDGTIVLPRLDKEYISIVHEYIDHKCIGMLEFNWNYNNQEWEINLPIV